MAIAEKNPPPAEIQSSDLALLLLETLPRVMRLIRSQFLSEQSKVLTLPQMRLLAQLRRSSRTNSELADLMGVSLPAITRMVNTLVRRNLVYRTESSQDRRRSDITLTDLGLETYTSLRFKVQKRLAVICGPLTEADRLALLGGLEILKRLPGADNDGDAGQA